MSMVFCRGCGKQVHVSAASCPGCGAVQPTTAAGPAQVLASAQFAQDEAGAWQRRFALIEKAGGPKLPKLRSLPFKEIFAIKWNLWAFLFGPFYYAAKGMWKRGLALFALGLIIVVPLSALLEAMGVSSNILLFVMPGISSGHANTSYYRLVKEKTLGWW